MLIRCSSSDAAHAPQWLASVVPFTPCGLMSNPNRMRSISSVRSFISTSKISRSGAAKTTLCAWSPGPDTMIGIGDIGSSGDSAVCCACFNTLSMILLLCNSPGLPVGAPMRTSAISDGKYHTPFINRRWFSFTFRPLVNRCNTSQVSSSAYIGESGMSAHWASGRHTRPIRSRRSIVCCLTGRPFVLPGGIVLRSNG